METVTDTVTATVADTARDSMTLTYAIDVMDHGMRRDEVRLCRAQATAYVWGYQDATGGDKDTSESWDFAVAYAWHAYDYATAARFNRLPIQAAYQEWTRTKKIAGI